MKSETEVNLALSKYANTIRRICFMHLKNIYDVEDVFQDVFLKYVLYTKPFESDAHEKAWLIRISINACKDLLKSFFRQKVGSIEDAYTEPFYIEDKHRDILDAVLKLPDKYKNVIYLFYYEGYTAVEIANILHKNENTIYTWLSRAKRELKTTLGGEYLE